MKPFSHSYSCLELEKTDKRFKCFFRRKKPLFSTLPGLDGDEIHATLPAVIPGVEPVPVGVPELGFVAKPGHPVKMVTKTLVPNTIHPWKKY